jgi:hypothetical protein
MKHAMALLFLLVGCTVGEVPIGGGGTDGGGGSDSGGGGDSGNLNCANRITASAATGHGGDINDTRAGQACNDGGCHNPDSLGAGAPAFLAAGTVYQADGVTPSAGLTVRLKPAGSTTPLISITDTAGRFSFANNVINAFPATTEVTACPSQRPMVSALQTSPAAGGNCSSGLCHAAGGATGVIKE